MVPNLFAAPLNESFPVDGSLLSKNYLQIPSPEQWGAQGAFFQDADETLLYSFGAIAEGKGKKPSNKLNTFNITSGEWSNVTVAGGDYNYDNRVATNWAVSKGSSEAMGFVSGGWNDLGGMIKFDASQSAKPKWQNETNNSPPLSLEGQMEYIRLGRKGSLVSFGGYDKNHPNPALKNWAYDLRPMNQISVYDIDSAKWYNITADGDIPQLRSAFCTAVSSAPDDSSFQITIYGGFDLFSGVAYSDTFVLTIPAFRWIDVTDNSNSDSTLSTSGDQSGRFHHSCVAYKDREMMVLGGLLRSGNTVLNSNACDRKYPAIRALDLSTFEFLETWKGSPEPYYVPDVVTRVIGGDGKGGAKMTQPEGGFNDSALTDVFSKVVPRYALPITKTSSVSSGSGTTNPSAPNEETKKLSSGAVAGIALGALAGVGALAALALLYLRRVKQKRKTGALMDDVDHSNDKKHESVISNGATQPDLENREYYKPPVEMHGQHTTPRSEMDVGWVGGPTNGLHKSEGRGSELGADDKNTQGFDLRGDRRRVSELPG